MLSLQNLRVSIGSITRCVLVILLHEQLVFLTESQFFIAAFFVVIPRVEGPIYLHIQYNFFSLQKF